MPCISGWKLLCNETFGKKLKGKGGMNVARSRKGTPDTTKRSFTEFLVVSVEYGWWMRQRVATVIVNRKLKKGHTDNTAEYTCIRCYLSFCKLLSTNLDFCTLLASDVLPAKSAAFCRKLCGVRHQFGPAIVSLSE